MFEDEIVDPPDAIEDVGEDELDRLLFEFDSAVYSQNSEPVWNGWAIDEVNNDILFFDQENVHSDIDNDGISIEYVENEPQPSTSNAEPQPSTSNGEPNAKKSKKATFFPQKRVLRSMEIRKDSVETPSGEKKEKRVYRRKNSVQQPSEEKNDQV